MKSLLIALTFMSFLSSCSKPSGTSQGSPVLTPEPDSVIAFSAITINTVLEEGSNVIPSPESSIDFGSLEKGQAASQEIIIVNKQLASLVIAQGDINLSDLAPFELVSNTCVTTLARNRSCKIQLKLSNAQELSTDIELSKMISIKGSEIALVGKQLKFVPPTAPEAGVTIAPLSLDFGTLKAGQVKELTVVVTNKNIANQTVPAPSFSSPNVTLTNGCTAALARNRSCSLRFKYTANQDEVVTNLELTSLLRNPIVYSVNVASPTIENPEIVLVSPVALSSTVAATEPQVKTGVIQFQNKGTIPFPSPVIAVSSTPGLVLATPSCSAGLDRNRVCSVSYTLNSSLAPAGSSIQTVKIMSGTLSSSNHELSINITKTAPVITFEPVYSAFAPCSAALACSGAGTASRVIESCQKLSNGSPVSGGQISDCSGFAIPANLSQTCLSPAGNVTDIITGGTKTSSCLEGSTVKNFSSLACSTGFKENLTSQLCEPKVITYQPTYSAFGACSAAALCSGAGTETRTITSCQKLEEGQPISGGQISDCSAFAIPANLSQVCQSPAGVQSSSNITGGSLVNTCALGATAPTQAVTCTSNYSPNQTNLTCEAITFACTESAALANQVSFVDSNSAVTGDQVGDNVSACLLASNSCNQYYKLSNNTKSCIPKLCSELSASEKQAKFPQDYQYIATLSGTILTGNVVNCTIATCISGYNVDNGSCVEAPSLTIASTSPLEFTRMLITGGAPLTGPGSVTAATPPLSFFSGGANSQALQVTFTNSSVVSTGTGANNPISLMATSQQARSVLTESTPLTDCNAQPYFVFPINSTACQMNGLSLLATFNTTDLVNLVQIKNYMDIRLNGSEVGQFPLHKYEISQVSNTRPTGPDFVTQSIIASNYENNNKLYFNSFLSGTNAYSKLVEYDPATGSITQRSNIMPGNTDAPGGSKAILGDNLYFLGILIPHSRLYKMDLNSKTITRLSNINASGNDLSGKIVNFNNAIYFQGFAPPNLVKIMKFDPSNNRITQVSNVRPGSNEIATIWGEFNGKLYFSATTSGSTYNLYRITSTDSIEMVSSTLIPAALSSPMIIAPDNSGFFFICNEISGSNRICKFTESPDPVTSGATIKTITRVSKINNFTFNATNFEGVDDPTILAQGHGGFYFAANSPTAATNTYKKIFKYEFSTGTIKLITNLQNAASDLPPAPVGVFYKNEFYFSAAISGLNYKLFKVDEQGVVKQVVNINAVGSDAPSNFYVFNDELYFSALMGANTKLFKLKKTL